MFNRYLFIAHNGLLQVYKRLEQLKNERAQITEKLQVVMRQRDMFKAIADVRQTAPTAVTPDPAIPADPRPEATRRAVRNLHSLFL